MLICGIKDEVIFLPFTMFWLSHYFNVFRLNKNIFSSLKGLIFDLPSPINISYFWNFGSLLGLTLLLQIFSGFFLSMHFVSDVNLAFASLDLLRREIWNGWLLRYFHILGASLFFLFMYIHIGRGLYYSSFLFYKTWFRGIILLLLSMAAAFLGYVLPWGQMSYWGATVITNFFSVIPFIGPNLVIWIWGGFAVDYPTLTRFFSLHFILPLILVVFVVFHLIFLHETGSKNPLGLKRSTDKVAFFPLFALKDILGFFVYFVLAYCFFLSPFSFMEFQKFIEANSLVTPLHIQPEWYFLPAYAILRSIPKKLGGVVSLVMFIVVLCFPPLLYKKKIFATKKTNFRGISFSFNFQVIFWCWIFNFFCLMWVGACPVEYPFLYISQISSFFYFTFFLTFLF